MKFFGYDGPLARGIRYLWDLFCLSVCCWLCCLPVFTAGAAVTALYSVFLCPGDGHPIRSFFRALRDNFAQATCLWLIYAAIGLPLVLDGYLLLAYRFPGHAPLAVLTCIAAALYLSVGAFLFPLQARYANPLRRTLKNALLLGLSMAPKGILMAAITLLPVWLFPLDLQVFLYVASIWLPLGPGLAAQLNAFLLRGTFERLEKSGEETA